jgi:hypothetical protein
MQPLRIGDAGDTRHAGCVIGRALRRLHTFIQETA